MTGPRSPRHGKAPIGLAVLAMIAAGCGGGTPPLVGCEREGAVTPICGFQNPEDLVQLPGSSWLLVSQFADLEAGVPGSLVALRLADERRRHLYPPKGEGQGEAPAAAAGADWGAADCPGPPDAASFAPHGVDVARIAGRGVAVAVVNHGGREAVELFALRHGAAGPALRWRGCVPMPDGVWPNDVALLGEGGFVVSNMMRPAEGELDTLLVGLVLIAGRDSGSVLEWQPGAGWRELAGSAGSAPNGVAVSPDGRDVYFTEWAGDRLVRLSRVAEDPVRTRRAVDLPHHPDNLSWTRDGRLLVAGQLGTITDALGCGAIEEGTCALGYSVLRVDPLSLETELLHEDRGAGSVALEVGDDVYIGTFAGDRIARLSPPR